MPALIFLVAYLTIALGIGHAILQRLDRHAALTWCERFAIAPLLGVVVFYYLIQFVGVVRLDVWSVSIAIVVLLPIAVIGLRTLPWADLKAAVSALGGTFKRDPWYGFLFVVFCAIALTSLLQGMAPPNDYDSLMYHITGPKFDVESGIMGMPWDRGLGHFLFPGMMSNQSRLALILSNAGAAQMVHGAVGVVGAIITSLVMMRFGYGRKAGILAAVLFISTRVVVWEMGSVEVDVPLAVFAIACVLVYSILRERLTIGLGILFGILVGGMVLTKFHGFVVAAAFGPIILHDVWARRRVDLAQIVGPVIAMVMYIPHGVRVYGLTGNPFFPVLNQFFDPNGFDLFGGEYQKYGTRSGFGDLFTTPWTMFIEPMRYFDGMIFGVPIFLILIPLMLMDLRAARRWAWCFVLAGGYYIVWYYGLTQQVRFLLPIMPLFACFAAAGAIAMWEKTAGLNAARIAFIGLAGLLFLGQAMFVGIYTVIRLPVAVGLMSPLAYHSKTPTLGGANFVTCQFITDNLKPGEQYLVLLAPLSFYCPQKAAVTSYFSDEAKWWLKGKRPPSMDLDEFLRRYKNANFRFVLLPKAWVNRRNLSAEEHEIPIDPAEIRFSEFVYPAIADLRPLAADTLSAVYDGPALLAQLEKKFPK